MLTYEPLSKGLHIQPLREYNKGLSQVIGKGLFKCALIVSYLSRLNTSFPHVLLYRLDGHLLSVKNI